MMDEISYFELTRLADPKEWVSSRIANNQLIRVKNCVDKDYISDAIRYLTGVMEHSIPNYQPLVEGAPNFYRINFEDQRAHVKAFMHQFNFFEWNQDRLDLFNRLGFLFDLREMSISESVDYTGTVKRISFQYYPSGRGYMKSHRDPIGMHQAGVVTVVMSQKGVNYEVGGFSVERDSGSKLYPENMCEIGDVLIFNGASSHSVETIDPERSHGIFSSKGRWVALIAVTKSAGNQTINDSEEM